MLHRHHHHYPTTKKVCYAEKEDCAKILVLNDEISKLERIINPNVNPDEQRAAIKEKKEKEER